MATKNILLAIEDIQTVADINEALGNEWLTTHVTNEADALALLEAGPFDALLVDFNLGASDASELLNQALEKCPNTTRFLFAYEADLALVAAQVLGDHEILPKPLEFASLKSRIESALSDAGPTEVGLATGFDTASSIPVIYDELLQALKIPGVTSQEVGEIIARDDTLIQEILTLARPAYLGESRSIVEPVEAVEVLGLETVRALVLALRFLAEHSHVRPGYLSLEKIWQHSINVAQIARDLVLFETKDRALASQALAAGLVHDLGKVVLATNFDDLYCRVHSLARKQPVALWEIETEMFGANHGEIGACLLGMWNLPAPIVEAAASHHQPPVGEASGLTPLAAVHIANVLEYQLHPSDEFRVVPVMNPPYLNELGLLHRLPIWRATFAKHQSRAAAVEKVEADPLGWVAAAAEAGAATRTANQLPAPAAETQTTTAAPAGEQSSGTTSVWRKRWTYAGIAVGSLCLFVLSLRLGLEYGEPLYVRARAFDGGETVAAVPSVPLPEPVMAAEPEPEPVMVAPTEEPAESVAVLPAPPVVAEVTPASLPPKETVPTFRLTGFSYGVNNPSAIVNGKTVYVGDDVSGATVISIGRGEVTLEINGERKTVGLRGIY